MADDQYFRSNSGGKQIDGQWTDVGTTPGADGWNNGLPNASTDAIAAAAYTQTVDFNTTAEVHSLGSMLLDIQTGSLQVDSATNASNQVVVNQGMITIANGASFTLAAGAGTYQVSAFSTAGTVTIGAGATLEVSGTDTLGGTISGAGTLELAGTASLPDNITVGTLELAGGTQTLGAGFTSFAGNVNFVGDSEVDLSGQTVSLGAASNSFSSGGVFGGAGTVIVTGSANVSSFQLSGVTLEDAGKMTESGNLTIQPDNSSTPGELLIDPGATYTMNAPSKITAGQLSATVVNKGSLVVDDASGGASGINVLDNESTVTVEAGNTLTFYAGTTTPTINDGTIDVAKGALIVDGPLSANTGSAGTIVLGPELQPLIAPAANPGTSSDPSATFNSSVAASQTVRITGHPSTISLTDEGEFAGHITGFTGGDTLDLVNEIVTIQSYDGTTLTVQQQNGGRQTYALSGPVAGSLTTKSDNNGGTDIVVMCFASGTRIRAANGADLAVEVLGVGDRVMTASGETRPIRWIGRRTIACADHVIPSAVSPVRILAGAFGAGICGEDLPERDLYLSPGHPVLVGEGANEVLVPIMCLINGTSIARVPVETVTYWHVELDRHDIVLAEGLPAESFLDFGNRPWFEYGADDELTNPDLIPPGLGTRCRPVAIDGPLVEAERRRINALFATSLMAHCAWPATDAVAFGL